MHLSFFGQTRLAIILVVLLSTATNPALAQTIWVGAKGGVPLTEPFILTNDNAMVNSYTFQAKRYTGGPFVQLNLPLNFAFEADALYKRLHYESDPFLFGTLHASTSARSWEFPLIVKRTFPLRSLHAYGGIGVALRRSKGETDFSNSLLQSRDAPLELENPWSTGLALSGGIDVSRSKFHFQPEVRYTRWGTRSFVSGNGLFNSNLNSIDLLIGVAYGK
jgi:hypothetical protein